MFAMEIARRACPRIGVLVIACAGLSTLAALAAKPGTGGGGTATAAPDIVYLSASNQSMNTEIRGVALTVASNGALTSADSSLIKPAMGRSTSALAWSPDGKRFAWIENGAILSVAPGGRPTQLYPTAAGEPKPLNGGDTLAWGPDCSGEGDSVVAFLSDLPNFSVELLRIKGGAVVGRVTLVPLPTHCNADQSLCTMAGAGSFAFSPRGQHLAFYGFADTLARGVWAVPLCVAGHSPAMILGYGSLGSTSSLSPLASIDWSPAGRRLALSVVTGPNPDYPWRDIKIADLNYYYSDGVETVSSGTIRVGNIGSSFGAASSEISPVWDRNAAGDGCQRLAFSQSSDAGRRMYTVDLGSGAGCNGQLRSINAQNPRALAWRAKQ